MTINCQHMPNSTNFRLVVQGPGFQAEYMVPALELRKVVPELLKQTLPNVQEGPLINNWLSRVK